MRKALTALVTLTAFAGLAGLASCSQSPSTPAGGGPSGNGVGGGAGGAAGSGGATGITTACVAPPPPAEALRKVGTSNGVSVLPGGRTLTPAGQHTVIGGFPVDVRVHPSLPIAYVSNTGFSRRSLQVITLGTGAIAQEIPRPDAYVGLALSADGKRLYASGGASNLVEAYDIGTDGLLKAAFQVPVSDYPAGLALSADGKTLWVGQFVAIAGQPGISEVDLATMQVKAKIPLPYGAYGIAEVPNRHELYVTGFREHHVAVIDLALHSVVAQLDVGKNPEGVAVSSDGARAFVSLSDMDSIVAIDTMARSVIRSTPVGEVSIGGEDGKPLAASSPAGLALDSSTGRLYVARAADNAVSVLDSKTLQVLGSIPVGWYPTSVAVASDAHKLVVTNGKGVGTGPNGKQEYGPSIMQGSVSVVPLDGLDLNAMSAKVEANVRRPSELYPFDCQGSFPVPTHRGGQTPIQHVMLIVRENKTYDALLGDLKAGDGKREYAIFGSSITPNLHAIARRFAHHDNFYDDSEVSVQGHLWLTSSFVNDYMERAWIEDYRNHGNFSNDSGLSAGQPSFGTFFTHLIKHNVSFTNYGEVVGALGVVGTDRVINHTDLNFPGPFFDLVHSDEERATYVTKQIVEGGKFPSFVYMILPRDHTQGTTPGALTPEAMVADNDYATGLLIDRISHSKYWGSTAIFIVEDDPQTGADHVDYHRSICMVVSPWAKRGHVSSVHTSYPSIFRTIELILGLPPMNRYDALATPLWDVFTSTPDTEPFTVVARSVADAKNPLNAPGAALSKRMDFSAPDRNPQLGELLWRVRTGQPLPGSQATKSSKTNQEAKAKQNEDLSPAEDDPQEHDAYSEALRAVQPWMISTKP